MHSTPKILAGLAIVALSLVWTACDGSNPVMPSPDPMPTGSGTASFQINGAGQNQTLSWASGANTVFCTRNAGWASLFIRFAEQTQAGGGVGPRLDIDLCNHGGGGTFTPKDPRVAACDSAKTWNVFWHAADGSVFANSAMANGCTLQMDQLGDQLMGSFRCTGLIEDGGGRTVDVVNGSFSCDET